MKYGRGEGRLGEERGREKERERTIRSPHLSDATKVVEGVAMRTSSSSTSYYH
jgi:hypothetical protein